MTYVILDLETTGLNPETCDLLELGFVILDDEFNEIGIFEQVVQFKRDRNSHLNINEFVLNLHTGNGLWDACEVSTRSLAQIEEAALEVLNLHAEAGKVELTGNTISFDRAFLKKYMPKLEAWFHYRNIDISTLKVLGDKYGVPPLPKNLNLATHRSVSDCDDSSRELQHYLKEFGMR